jgi:hypothetical protein
MTSKNLAAATRGLLAGLWTASSLACGTEDHPSAGAAGAGSSASSQPPPPLVFVETSDGLRTTHHPAVLVVRTPEAGAEYVFSG